MVIAVERRNAQNELTSRPRWRRPGWPVWGISVIALLGLILYLLPGVAAWFSQALYSQEVRELTRAVSSIEPEERVLALSEARDYNRRLITSAVTIGANENVPRAEHVTDDDDAYNDILSADSQGLMARLKIPAISVDLPVYHGTADDTLRQGAGHLEGSALPVGGVDTHSILTAHRGLSQAELFTNLDRVDVNDVFSIEVFGEVLTYRVIETAVVEPDETESLFPRSGRDLVTLITCTPLGINSHRILVTGERVTPTPTADLLAMGQEPEVPGFPWWIVHLAGGVLVISTYIVWNSRRNSHP